MPSTRTGGNRKVLGIKSRCPLHRSRALSSAGIRMIATSERPKSAVAPYPFVPGFGGIPPYLAGREHEQLALTRQLERLVAGEPVQAATILYGPRGNGKTVLLEWTRRQADAKGIKAISLSSASITTDEALARKLSARSRWNRILAAISWRGVQAQDQVATNIDEALAKLVHKQPLVLLIDEAHSLRPEIGTQILNATQSLTAQGFPFMLVLAGTPDLPSSLGRMHSTFWERSRILPLGLLDQRASADAIRIPLEDSSQAITPEALARITEESHGYPYFLQLWAKPFGKGSRYPPVSSTQKTLIALGSNLTNSETVFTVSGTKNCRGTGLSLQLPVSQGRTSERKNSIRPQLTMS